MHDIRESELNTSNDDGGRLANGAATDKKSQSKYKVEQPEE